MAAQVIFDRGLERFHGVLEEFPLDGGEKVPCLVLQPESGAPPTRVKVGSDEAKALVARFPELKAVGGKAAASEDEPAAEAPAKPAARKAAPRKKKAA